MTTMKSTMKPLVKLLVKPVALVCLLSVVLFAVGCKDIQPLLQTAAPIVQAQLAAPSQSETGRAIKLALGEGAKQATSQLGIHDAFYQSAFKILLPNELQSMAEKARALGLSSYVDAFEQSMNRAAEKAVPVAATILQDSIRQMSLSDVVSIMQGPDNAATQFLKRTSKAQIFQRFLPIVTEQTAAVGVTRQYKKLSSIINAYGAVIGTPMPKNMDLDIYITDSAVDALFVKMAEKERAIRANPWGESSDLLRRVFTYYR